MGKKIIKGVLYVLAIWALIVFCFVVYLFIIGKIEYLGVSDKPMDSDIVSAKEIATYVNDEIQNIRKLDKYDLVVGEVKMEVNAEHRGEVTVIFAEKRKKRPLMVRAKLNTKTEIFNTLEFYGRESKLYPGIINIQDWNIDSTDAVKIAEDFFSDDEEFRYDKILINTSYIYTTGEEKWSLIFSCADRDKRHHIKIDVYSGEISSSSYW